MKKILAIVLTLLMVASFAACAKDNTDTLTDGNADAVITEGDVSEEISEDITEEITEEEITDEVAGEETAAVAALSAVWEEVIADEALVAAFGATSSEELAGYFAGGDSFVMGAPGAYSVEDKEVLTFTFGVPAENTAEVAELATIMHAMNGNNLTAAAYVLTEDADAAAFAAALKDGISSMQFLCGAPEQLIIAEADGVVIAAFGGADIINAFSAALSVNGTVLVEDAIA